MNDDMANQRVFSGSKVSRDSWDLKLRTPLAKSWPTFVDCRKRLETQGPFLLNLISEETRRILDAAMGTGCEAVFLAERHLDVTGNEIDRELAHYARDRARLCGVDIRITNIAWCDLSKHFEKEEFDLTLLLGNSLCLLRDQPARDDAVRNLRAVCKQGGMVAVDERNFEYMLQEREQILRGKFRYSRRVMYCGTLVRGRPIIIEDDHVRFVYENVRDGAILGHLDMHPFRRGELIQLFMRAGFVSVEVFSDLVLGEREGADFYTYVFR